MSNQTIIFGIWFGCGFLCREVILRHQIAQARQRMQKDLDGIRSRFDKIRIQFEKEMANGTKHSNKK